MKAISRWLDRFCYDHPNFGIPELMKYIAVGNVIVFVLDIVTRGYATMMLMFSPSAVLHGQIWRLFTFILIPLNRFNPSRPFTLLWFVMSTFFYYWPATSPSGEGCHTAAPACPGTEWRRRRTGTC